MKVLPFKIPKPEASTLFLQEDKVRSFYGILHQHTETQLSFIVKGQGKLIVSNSVHSYAENDIFVIGSNTPHLFQSAKSHENSHMITLFISADRFISDFKRIPELEELSSFFSECGNGVKVTSHANEIIELIFQMRNSNRFATFLFFLQLVQKINSADKRKLSSYLPTKKITNLEGRRLQLVFDYAVNNFEKEITLDQIAGILPMTTPSFCRFFKQRTNKTFFEFLIELRIAHACELLLQHEKKSIAEISEASGFHSISNFNRSFKKLKKVSPSQFARTIEQTMGF
ncbi:MAG: AraC family transcriptional regulator [Flavobacteriaceae bacterium]